MKQVKTRYQCHKCNFWFSAKGGNFKKHISVCDGNYRPIKKSEVCKYCGYQFYELANYQIANHTRWCDNNPKRNDYVVNNLANMRSYITTESRKRAASAISKAHAEGKYVEASKKAIETRKKKGNLFHTEETKQLLRKKALASKHRRLKKGTVMYNGILLDSSWELALAERLDELNIKWIRPEPLPWIDDDQVKHNYFPDFYLPDYDVYLDPKNPQAIISQKEKLEKLFTQYKNIVILHTIEECKTFWPPGTI